MNLKEFGLTAGRALNRKVKGSEGRLPLNRVAKTL